MTQILQFLFPQSVVYSGQTYRAEEKKDYLGPQRRKGPVHWQCRVHAWGFLSRKWRSHRQRWQRTCICHPPIPACQAWAQLPLASLRVIKDAGLPGRGHFTLNSFSNLIQPGMSQNLGIGNCLPPWSPQPAVNDVWEASRQDWRQSTWPPTAEGLYYYRIIE